MTFLEDQDLETNERFCVKPTEPETNKTSLRVGWKVLFLVLATATVELTLSSLTGHSLIPNNTHSTATATTTMTTDAHVTSLQLTDDTPLSTTWPPHPKKLHHGEVKFTSHALPDSTMEYKREFVVPCHYGVLVLNIGPASQDVPFSYDIYEDAYGFSDNQHLCWLYPSYRATQTSSEILWNPVNDPTEQRLALQPTLQRITTRLVPRPRTQSHTGRAGDFVVLGKGDFFNPDYYQALLQEVRSWPADGVTTTSRTVVE